MQRVIQTMRIGEMGMAAAQFFGARSHMLRKSLLRSVHSLRKHIGGIVGGSQQHGVHHLLKRDLFAGIQCNMRRIPLNRMHCFRADCHRFAEIFSAFQHEQCGHQLGNGCRMRRFVHLFFQQHLPVFRAVKHRLFSCKRRLLRRRAAGTYQKRHQQHQKSFHKHIPLFLQAVLPPALHPSHTVIIHDFFQTFQVKQQNSCFSIQTLLLQSKQICRKPSQIS